MQGLYSQQGHSTFFSKSKILAGQVNKTQRPKSEDPYLFF